MIVLDTNVLSEFLRPAPETRVVRWMDDQSRPSLFVTTITRAEVLHGIRLLAAGRRRQGLQSAAHAIFNQDFDGKLLSFDGDAADAYAEISVARKEAGRPISVFDALIAAIVRSRGASLATRNPRDFELCEIKVIDPWMY